MANAKAGQARAADVIKNWIRTRTTLEFLGTWEQLYNPGRAAIFCSQHRRMDYKKPKP
jgi:hypothetical protein